jgi:hypothetical protein
MPVEQGPLEHIVNVHWGGAPLGFLYSGDDGMYGSEDGESWTKAPSSVRATALAWIDDVWIASGPGGYWRSEDGAKSWKPVSAPKTFTQLAAMLPKSTASDDKPKSSLFAAYGTDEDTSNDIIYTSQDLGKTWNAVKTFEADFGDPDHGYEFVSGLSGCNGQFFVTTIRGEVSYDRGSGWVYESGDGLSFSGNMVYGPGTAIPPDQPRGELTGYGCAAVAFDEQTDTYTLTGTREYLPGDGSDHRTIIYSTSGSPSFGSGMDYKHVAMPISIQVAHSLVGGNGAFATGITQYNYTPLPTSVPIDSQLTANFIPGLSTTLIRVAGGEFGPQTFGRSFVGSFCFNPMTEVSTGGEVSTAGTDGVFACIAASISEAGVYIAQAGGSFRKTHSGRGITDGQGIAAAVAVGKIDFLESSTA